MVQTLKPVIIPKKIEDEFKADLLTLFYDVLFEPLLQELDKLKFYYNDESTIRDALLSGKIEYVNGIFKGNFSARLTKEFNKLGIEYNERLQGFKKEINKLPVSIQSAIAQANLINKTINENMLAKVATLQIGEDKIKDVKTKYKSIIKSIDEQIEISVDLTEAEKEIIAKEYKNNLELYIKNFLDEETKKLRDEVEESVNAGYRAEHLKEIIKERYQVSESKAEFLAKQETSLLTSKYTQIRYKDAGINKYIWSTSGDNRVRHDHKELDGKIISYDDPPIVDKATGRKAHAGEDFGCRCIQVPVID